MFPSELVTIRKRFIYFSFCRKCLKMTDSHMMVKVDERDLNVTVKVEVISRMRLRSYGTKSVMTSFIVRVKNMCV